MPVLVEAMEASHPPLTTQKSFYVEISRGRDRAELVTDDAARLKENLEQATGARISALQGIGAAEPRLGKASDGAVRGTKMTADRGAGMESPPVPDPGLEKEASGETLPGTREKQIEMDLGL